MILYDKFEGAHWLLYVPLAAQLIRVAEAGLSIYGMHDFGGFMVGCSPAIESYSISLDRIYYAPKHILAQLFCTSAAIRCRMCRLFA